MTKNTGLRFERQIEIRDHVDMFVAGGGPAGVAAAVTAAQQGAKVFLAESQLCLGGMGTAGMLPVFMPFGDSMHFYADGFGRRLYERLEAEGGFASEFSRDPLSPTIHCETLKRVYDSLATESGVITLLTTQFVAVEAKEGSVSHAICASKSGIFAVAAKVFIDCTGDGDLCTWAGAPFEKGGADGGMMGGTLCSLWTGMDWPTVLAAKEDAETLLIRALKQDPGVVPQTDPHLPGIWAIRENLGGGNIGHAYGVDGTDERSLTHAAIMSRGILPHYERFYRTNLKGYEKLNLVATASLFGIRETRRVLGDYVLNAEDHRRQAVFDDEIGRYNYWIDTHLSTPDLKEFEKHMALRSSKPKPGESYGIPYRCLTPRGLSNVLVAGRCVSTDRAVQSSLRVMPGCFITGQAAGMAATMMAAAKVDNRSVDVKTLQRRLKDTGAFLPNAD